MRALLAGASGTLGGPLVRALLAAGHEVTGITRTPEGAGRISAAGASPMIADVLDRDSLLHAVRGERFDAVIHELTALRKAPLRFRDMDGTNQLRQSGSAHLVEAARETGARRFVTQSIVTDTPATFPDLVRAIASSTGAPQPLTVPRVGAAPGGALWIRSVRGDVDARVEPPRAGRIGLGATLSLGRGGSADGLARGLILPVTRPSTGRAQGVIMIVVGLVLAGFAAAFHVYVFYLESVAWTGTRARQIFGVRSEQHAEIMKPLAVNQGFYNLFLAILVGLGIVFFTFGSAVIGATLVFAGCGSMVAAGAVLVISSPSKARAAALQAGPPLLAVAALAIGLVISG